MCVCVTRGTACAYLLTCFLLEHSDDTCPDAPPLSHSLSMQVLGSLLQGFVIIFLMFGLLAKIAFQPKLMLLMGTLSKSAPDMAHFVLVLTVSTLPLAVL